MSRNPVLYKTLVIGVIVMFFTIGAQPVIALTRDELLIESEIKSDNVENVKFPLLYALILYITNVKVNRWLKWVNISADIVDGNFRVTNPVIFIYSLWLLMRLTIWDNFWTFLDENYDLNWNYPSNT